MSSCVNDVMWDSLPLGMSPYLFKRSNVEHVGEKGHEM